MSRRQRTMPAIVPAILLTAVLAASCGRPPAPPAKDYTKGDFYTSEEVTRLDQAERDAYCDYLDATLRDLKDEAQILRARLDSIGAEAESLRVESTALSSETRQVTTELRSLRLKEKALTSYVVREGDTLRSIASRVYGDPGKWGRIYEANKGKIGAEDADLKVGMRLDVPREGE